MKDSEEGVGCLRPYHPEGARSHLISEAKAGLGLISTWMGEAGRLSQLQVLSKD